MKTKNFLWLFTLHCQTSYNGNLFSLLWKWLWILKAFAISIFPDWTLTEVYLLDGPYAFSLVIHIHLFHFYIWLCSHMFEWNGLGSAGALTSLIYSECKRSEWSQDFRNAACIVDVFFLFSHILPFEMACIIAS